MTRASGRRPRSVDAERAPSWHNPSSQIEPDRGDLRLCPSTSVRDGHRGVTHIAEFGSREAIAHTKSELLTALPSDGLAIVPSDDDYLDVGASSAVDWLKLVYIGIPLAFLVGVLRTSLQRAAVGDLIVELGDVASAAGVRDALARTLGDPSLELAFWLPGKRRYVDLNGKPMSLPKDDDRAVTELEGVAALVYDSSLLEDPGLVRSAGAAARLALENARLQAELRSQLERRRETEGGQLRADFVTAPTEHDALAELTTRELEVLSLLAEGRTDRGIGQALYVTPKTVEAHVRSIFRKLELPSDAMENRRVHAVLTFLRAQTTDADVATRAGPVRARPRTRGQNDG